MVNCQDSAIAIQNLKKSYDNFELYIPNLSIEVGTCVGLIGENGAGKSTLIKLMLQLIKRDDGVVRILGQDGLSKDLKKDVSVVFDSNSYNGSLTIQGVATVLKDVYGTSWDEAFFFEQVNKGELPIDKNIDSFSLGMKAKLNIYIALSHHPKIIILDEATSNLDPVVRMEINRFIKDYVERTGATVVFSSHIVNELEEIADRLVFLHVGRIALDVEPDQLDTQFRLVKVEKDQPLPEDAIGPVSDGEGLLCIVGDAEGASAAELVKQGVSPEEVLYFLSKGAR